MMDKEVAQAHDTNSYNWIADFVYGGMDGAVTTFAVVAGVEGASLSISIILILGFANLFADGFSMAVGKYTSDKAEIDQYNKIKHIEFQHLKEKPEHEREEIKEIFERYGFTGNDLTRATDIITSDDERWVEVMMRHEFNMTLENTEPVKGAVATFASFVLIGFIPLIAYTFQPILNLTQENAFIVTCIGTLGALFIVGAVKSKFTAQNWLISGLEVAGIGGAAAAISYIVGLIIKGLI